MLDYDEYDDYKKFEKRIPQEKELNSSHNQYTEDDLEDWRQWAEEWVEKNREN